MGAAVTAGWTPDELQQRLGGDLRETSNGQPRHELAAAAAVPDGLPDYLAGRAREAPGSDRSSQHYALVVAAAEAGLSDEQVGALVLAHAPSLDKYGAGAVAEAGRSLDKVRPLHDHVGRRCDESECPNAPAWLERHPKPRTTTAAPTSLGEVVTTFQRWLHLPDPGALLVVLATVAANRRRDDDPVWLLLVGPPGGGKTEMLQALLGLPNVHPCSTLTEASLLSGTSVKDKAAGAKGGLLRVIGDYGVILCKDFGSVLTMHHDARAAVLGALREIYDGQWVRHVGTDGGRTLSWSGKIGLVAGVTPAVDRHHAAMASLGERFTLYRMPVIDAPAHARRALTHAGHEKPMRVELTGAVAGLFASIDAGEPGPALSEADTDRLIDLATLGVRCRSAVERDGRDREIELIPEAEAPGRLALVLARLLGGLASIGAEREEAWRLVAKTTLDSMPALRRRLLELLVATSEPSETATLATSAGYPTTTARRSLQDLAAHGVVERIGSGKGRADRWSASEWTRERWAATVPESAAALPDDRSRNGG